ALGIERYKYDEFILALHDTVEGLVTNRKLDEFKKILSSSELAMNSFVYELIFFQSKYGPALIHMVFNAFGVDALIFLLDLCYPKRSYAMFCSMLMGLDEKKA